MTTTKEQESNDVDKRSEEVADIIERFPDGWAIIISSIMATIVLVVVILSFVIKYPDTVSGQLSITGIKAPIRIVAETSGRLHLLAHNKTNLHTGDCIGYIESGAKYEDILKLDTLCVTPLDEETVLSFPDSMTLGALEGLYNDFCLAYTKYAQLRSTKIYDNMRRALTIQKSTTLGIISGLQNKIALHKSVYTSIERQYQGDSILYASGAISNEVLEQKRSNLIASQLTGIEYDVSEKNKCSEIRGIDVELAKMDISVEEERLNAYNTLLGKRNILAAGLQQWKNNYLLISPIDGTLEYLGFWRENVFVNSGKEIFSISPNSNTMIGEMFMSVTGAGKVKTGQDVNVKLADYPYDEYGYIKGRVHSISKLTSNLQVSDGLTKAYLVEVSFPKGLRTNFGKQLTPNYEAIGTGEIITNKRRLIERLFDNLKAKTEK